jgi:hypothetical protein
MFTYRSTPETEYHIFWVRIHHVVVVYVLKPLAKLLHCHYQKLQKNDKRLVHLIHHALLFLFEALSSDS